MLDLLNRILGMFVYRPYVFAFFGVYVFLATRKMGCRQASVLTVVGYAIAFTAEFCSTRFGFPFGLYHYLELTRERELWIMNVPFWDSLSFTFLCYLGWRLGILLYSPLEVGEGDFQVLETREVRGSVRVAVTGAILVALLDVIIDPVTLQGERWFLGKLYYYPGGGIYFGVPISNFAGWLFVAGLTIWCYQRIDRMSCMDPARYHRGLGWVKWGGLLEPVLYGAIFLFNWGVTIAIGERLLALVDFLIFLPVMLLFLSRVLNSQRRATGNDWERHLADFPISPSRPPAAEEGAT